jgi:hypothetical protein
MIASNCLILYTRAATQWFQFEAEIWSALSTNTPLPMLGGSPNLFALCYTGVTFARQRPVWRGNA